MKDLKKKMLVILLVFFGLAWSFSMQAQTPDNKKETPTEIKSIPQVIFTPEDIEKVKTLIEQQLNKKLSDREFETFGKPTQENLELFQAVDEAQKDDPFFSQEHITFIIKSMSERLGTSKPKSNPHLSRKRGRKKM